MDTVAPREVVPQMRAAAERAVALDDRFATAHSMLGAVWSQYLWDMPTAERELHRAIELNPNDALAHSLLAALLLARNDSIGSRREGSGRDPSRSGEFDDAPGLDVDVRPHRTARLCHRGRSARACNRPGGHGLWGSVGWGGVPGQGPGRDGARIRGARGAYSWSFALDGC